MGFKAFLVAVDREACMLYKQALDKYLPVEYSHVIYITLRLVTENLSVNQAQEINMLFLKFPDYSWHDASKAQLRTELYKALRPIVGADKMISATDTLLKLKRI